MIKDKRAAKRRGIEAAKAWYAQAAFEEIVAVAGCDLQYGETLTALADDGYDVPESTDVDFSFGFFKNVKGHVISTLYKARKARREQEKGERLPGRRN